MNGIRGANSRTHQLTLLAALLIAAASVGVLLFGSGTSSEVTASTARAVFGPGRSKVFTTAGATVSGALVIPKGTAPEDVSWTVTYSENAVVNERVARLSGTTRVGTTFTFTAPTKGSAILESHLKIGASTHTSRSVFVVRQALAFAATNVTTTGTVTVNGTPSIRGEALPPGTAVDASDGTITYSVAAKKSGSLRGTITMSGTDFTLGSKLVSSRLVNIATVKRSAGTVKSLTAEVEHLDGVRYQAVQTPDAMAMVKGTEFTVTVSEDGTVVDVDDGVVRVIDQMRLFDAPQDVTKGESTSVDQLDDQLKFEGLEQAFDSDEFLEGTTSDPHVIEGYDYDRAWQYTDFDKPEDYGYGSTLNTLRHEQFNNKFVDQFIGTQIRATYDFRDYDDLMDKLNEFYVEHPEFKDDLMGEEIRDLDGDGMPDLIDEGTDDWMVDCTTTDCNYCEYGCETTEFEEPYYKEEDPYRDSCCLDDGGGTDCCKDDGTYYPPPEDGGGTDCCKDDGTYYPPPDDGGGTDCCKNDGTYYPPPDDGGGYTIVP